MSLTKTRVLFIVPYPQNSAPSQRLKFEQYYTIFRNNKIDITHRSFFSLAMWNVIYKKGYIFQKTIFTINGYFNRLLYIFLLHKYDIVYVHLWVTPFGPPIFEWIYRFRSKKIIYDIDDLIYLSMPLEGVNSFFQFFKGRRKPTFLMKHADHVITCTPFLDAFVKQFNQNTTDISSTIDTDIYTPKTVYAKNNKQINLGWSGSHTTSKYLYLLTPVFQKLKELGYDFKLIVMGDPQFHIDGIPIIALPWNETYEVKVIRDFDVGLYPLPNEKWVYGKSGLKALQYMGLGVPTIATAVGANFRIIDHGVNGYLVHNSEEWILNIIDLIESSDLRCRIGKNARDTIVSEFSIKSNSSKYLKIIQYCIDQK